MSSFNLNFVLGVTIVTKLTLVVDFDTNIAPSVLHIKRVVSLILNVLD